MKEYCWHDTNSIPTSNIPVISACISERETYSSQILKKFPSIAHLNTNCCDAEREIPHRLQILIDPLECEYLIAFIPVNKLIRIPTGVDMKMMYIHTV